MLTVFDIETEAQPEDLVLRFAPEFQAPANYKDPDKIAAYAEEARREWLAKAALSPLTGRILLATVAVDDDEPVVIEGAEWDVVDSLAARLHDELARGGFIVGFNSSAFDLPYLRQRALVLGRKFHTVFTSDFRGRTYWHDRCRDVLEMWQMSQRGGHVSNSLNNVAIALGLEGKTGDWGASFGRLYRENRAEALRYARRDVELTREIYRRLV